MAKEGSVAPKERINITFRPATGNAQEEQELPLKLLVLGASDVPYRDLLRRYHDVCAVMGPLPPPRVVNVDHGRRRFLLFVLSPDVAGGDADGRPGGTCVAPAMAWIDEPLPDAGVSRAFTVSGWAFKDGVGLAGVDVTLDGRVVATARYGLPKPGLAAFWEISTDPSHPAVGFEAEVVLPEGTRGPHWLGLVLRGKDGSVEPWPEQRVLVVD